MLYFSDNYELKYIFRVQLLRLRKKHSFNKYPYQVRNSPRQLKKGINDPDVCKYSVNLTLGEGVGDERLEAQE